jgi:hypothetical protein
MPRSHIFEGQKDWWHNACLFTTNDWYIYGMGYKRAVDVLTEEAMGDRGGLDCVIFPLVFCCRHYFEVTLKEIIKIRKTLGTKKAPRGHDLGVLWKEVKKLIREEGTQDVGTEKRIDDLIKALSVADKYATAFRYPTDIRGEPSLQGYTHLNVRKLKEEFDRASSYLDGIRTQWKIESEY